MPDRMQQFISIDRLMPEKRSAEMRRADFKEVYNEFPLVDAGSQASRCEQCGIPYCHMNCPLENNIPDWLRLAAEGRMQEAYETAQATNTFPEICGRICPQDRLCEGSCVLEQSRHGTVTIGAIERNITENAWNEGWVKAIKPYSEKPESVGIIGGGPAGLAAADRLRNKGYEVHVYDRYDRMGGLLMYGIPGFKLEKYVVQRRIDLLAESGVNFHTSVDVGRDISFAELQSRHQALLVATGVYKSRVLEMPGSGLPGIHQALDYLIASNRQDLGDEVPEIEDGTLSAAGKNVVVIGGGDTAMDCVRTAIRQGAKSVKCLYRRDRSNMPGSAREVQNAEEEGVEFVWQAGPESFLGTDNVTHVRAHEIRLGMADESGRQTPQPVPESSYNVEAELVIQALGFSPEDVTSIFVMPELLINQWRTLVVDEKTKMTNRSGIFAAGDIIRGASLVVWAIRDGREAAEGIHTYIQNTLQGQALDKAS